MKTRYGFVSNSSSSSFIIACDPIKLEDITNRSDCRSNIFMDGGYGLMDACDFFELTPRMVEEIKKNNQNFNNHSFYEVYEMIDSSSSIDVRTLPQRHVMFLSMDISYHTTDNLEVFIARYIKDQENEN